MTQAPPAPNGQRLPPSGVFWAVDAQEMVVWVVDTVFASLLLCRRPSNLLISRTHHRLKTPHRRVQAAPHLGNLSRDRVIEGFPPGGGAISKSSDTKNLSSLRKGKAEAEWSGLPGKANQTDQSLDSLVLREVP